MLDTDGLAGEDEDRGSLSSLRIRAHSRGLSIPTRCPGLGTEPHDDEHPMVGVREDTQDQLRARWSVDRSCWPGAGDSGSSWKLDVPDRKKGYSRGLGPIEWHGGFITRMCMHAYSLSLLYSIMIHTMWRGRVAAGRRHKEEARHAS